MANNDTLTLPISKATQKKLRALAMLTDANVGNIEEELAGYLDKVITERCIELLGGASVPFAEGVTYPITEEVEEIPVIKKGKMNGRTYNARSFAEAQQKLASKRTEEEDDEQDEEVEEAFSDLAMEDEISGHALSSDEDPQDNKSLEEQTEEDRLDPEEEAKIKKAFSKRHVADVGDDAEAFLDAAVGEPEEHDTDEIPSVTRGYAGVGYYGDRPVAATKSFESRIRKGNKARVQPYTGDED